MNNRSRMMQKAKEQVEKNNRWWEELMEIVRANRIDNRKPHEKVIDTTFDRAPEFYNGFKTLVTDDPQAECKKGLEHLHRGKGGVWEEYNAAHVCFLKAARYTLAISLMLTSIPMSLSASEITQTLLAFVYVMVLLARPSKL